MKKSIVTILLVIILAIFYTSSFSEEISLSGMSYDELVKLKDKINLAIWNSMEWEEVVVPQGTWIVGEDIPAGHWTIKCSDNSTESLMLSQCQIKWGFLKKNGSIDTNSSNGGSSTTIYVMNGRAYKDGNITETNAMLQDGMRVEIREAYGQAVFMPYSGKPSLGFRGGSEKKDTPDSNVSEEKRSTTQKDSVDIDAVVDEILSYKNGETEKAYALLKEHASMMTSEQKESCLLSCARWSCLEPAEDKIKTYLKSPRSYYRYEGSLGKPELQDDGTYKVMVKVKYGATNSFGGEVTDEVTLYVTFTANTDTLEYKIVEAKLSPLDAYRYAK